MKVSEERTNIQTRLAIEERRFQQGTADEHELEANKKICHDLRTKK